MKKNIKIIIVLFLLFLINCLLIKPKKKVEQPIQGRLFTYCFQAALYLPPTNEEKVLDNKNGTVSIIQVTKRPEDICNNLLGNKTGLFKIVYTMNKCLYGQVYRKVENDCKGTGTLSNYFGAIKLQMCTTNIQDCIDSPVNNACELTENFLSKYPSLDNFFRLKSEETPSGKDDYYWEIKTRNAFNMNGIGLTSPQIRYDSFFYIICVKDKERV